MKNSLNERAKAILKDLVNIPSISANPAYQKQVNQAATYLVNFLTNLGFVVSRIGTEQPLIVASYNVQSGGTLGFYAHYDVQAPEPLADWESPPFELTERSGSLYGRGTADDKGHLAQLLAISEALIQTQQLKNSLILVIEGEEEVGSKHFEQYLKAALFDVRRADLFYILDSGVKEDDTPLIEYGLRGLIAYELRIQTSKRDLHSGLAGNLVLNPAELLSRFFSTIKNSDGRITLPGFYDQVEALSRSEDQELKRTAHSEEELKKEFGVTALTLPQNSQLHFASKTLPSFDINGMYAGFSEGFKTIIPGYAQAHFSFRIVPNQNPAQIDKVFKESVNKFFKKFPVTYELKLISSSQPFLTPINSPTMEKTARLLSRHFKNKLVYGRSGGSIPAAQILARLTDKPVIITGFTQSDAPIHSPNENYRSSLFNKGLRVLSDLLNSQ